MSIFHVNQLLQNRYKQLLRASRQWRDLKNRMKSGLGHASEQDKSQDGSIAIFCPACPQPGLNLPDDWKKKYSSYVCMNCQILPITHWLKGMSSSEHSSWMEISPLNICGIGPVRRILPCRQAWHSWPILIYTSRTSEVELRWHR
jgi:hypothetical protein